MSDSEWVLWGQNGTYGPLPIKITGGTLAWCRRERRWRESDGGWSDLVIRRDRHV